MAECLGPNLIKRSEKAVNRNGYPFFRTNQAVKGAHKGVHARLKTGYGRRAAALPLYDEAAVESEGTTAAAVSPLCSWISESAVKLGIHPSVVVSVRTVD
jgi:hypothetical protein